ncbi:hypothetical protein Psed_2396 [Pseudonocardia dioxanivorans CB1190]|uniref:Uncharacterized protein n=1 Tax=Pseudonocardia dioxanivorans (strain ATCC 55486 / DSM 44775 / JCM 13855 / CB1190) TaxID=675635 RepID=F4CVP1_PSEUX|nr:hypothetical protein [Pseudonocardia dioxanivorans]AEA24601.1 hypothetical protein Psed_2396 [Pseudonocardia dioxanivorans CB1190]
MGTHPHGSRDLHPRDEPDAVTVEDGYPDSGTGPDRGGRPDRRRDDRDTRPPDSGTSSGAPQGQDA